MRHYRNEVLIRRNATLSKATLFLGLGILIVSFILSIIQRENIAPPIYLALIGVILSQIGMPIYNRWGRVPRMDQILDASFKGLDDRYALFHYFLGAKHALITPTGVYALVPRLEAGEITYSEQVWWKNEQKAGFLRRAGKRAIRNIEKEAVGEIRNLNKALDRLLPGHGEVDTSAILLFLHNGADVRVEAAPWTAVHIKKAKSEIRKLPKQRSFNAQEINRIVDNLQ